MVGSRLNDLSWSGRRGGAAGSSRPSPRPWDTCWPKSSMRGGRWGRGVPVRDGALEWGREAGRVGVAECLRDGATGLPVVLCGEVREPTLWREGALVWDSPLRWDARLCCEAKLWRELLRLTGDTGLRGRGGEAMLKRRWSELREAEGARPLGRREDLRGRVGALSKMSSIWGGDGVRDLDLTRPRRSSRGSSESGIFSSPEKSIRWSSSPVGLLVPRMSRGLLDLGEVLRASMEVSPRLLSPGSSVESNMASLGPFLWNLPNSTESAVSAVSMESPIPCCWLLEPRCHRFWRRRWPCGLG